ncbi:MAG: hypothetical protein HY774_26240 [Acidobacteria bacterium]|nr:hypothetical protein [Acidobacteriota bacterium]
MAKLISNTWVEAQGLGAIMRASGGAQRNPWNTTIRRHISSRPSDCFPRAGADALASEAFILPPTSWTQGRSG